MNKSYVITDYGKNHVLVNVETKEELVLERYAVWNVSGRTMTDVIEVSNDVEYLKDKYKVEEILMLAKNQISDENNICE